MKASQGQALVEWTIFSVAIMMLWSASFSMAQRLLHRTVAQSWSVLAARHALSDALTITPEDMILEKALKDRTGTAKVWFGGARAEYRLALPFGSPGDSQGDSKKRALLSTSSFWSGFRSSLFSE